MSQEKETGRARYRRLLRRHNADPFNGLSDEELIWLMEYEEAHPDDPLVQQNKADARRFNEGIIDAVGKLGSENIGLGAGIPSEEERVAAEFEKLKPRLNELFGDSREHQSEPGAESPPAGMPPARGTAARWIYALAAGIALLAISLYGVYQFALPGFYPQAALTALEQENLAAGVLRGASSAEDEFARGAAALLQAPGKTLGIFPYFDRAKLEEAVAHFQNAFENTENPAIRNHSAYYLGKAYLMLAEPERACDWLKGVQESRAVDYREEAERLLKTLPCGERQESRQ